VFAWRGRFRRPGENKRERGWPWRVTPLPAWKTR